MDDYGCWQVVRLLPQTVVRLPSPPERPVMDWAELLATGALWPPPPDSTDRLHPPAVRAAPPTAPT